jgi:Ser/Thr protein kinase RdoA (MazF antagonist)
LALHEVSLRVTGGYPHRHDGTRLAELRDLVDRDGALITMGSSGGADELRARLDSFDADLEAIGYRALPACVVHGDPTTFNVLADGEPPKPVGLIDFELADIEAPVADIAFCLWRSGRPYQHAIDLNFGRVRALLAGYRSVRPLTEDEVVALPACIRGRGLQMLVKRARLRRPDAGPLAQLRWVTTNAQELATAVAE